MAYENFKDLAWSTASAKVLRDKAFDIVGNPQHDRYKKQLMSLV